MQIKKCNRYNKITWIHILICEMEYVLMNTTSVCIERIIVYTQYNISRLA